MQDIARHPLATSPRPRPQPSRWRHIWYPITQQRFHTGHGPTCSSAPPAFTACGWEINTKSLKIPKCVDTSSDPNNCGGCGSMYACTPGEQCVASECKCGGSNCCPSGYLYCGGPVDNCCYGGEGTDPFTTKYSAIHCDSGFGCCPKSYPDFNATDGYCYTPEGEKSNQQAQCCQ